MEWSIASLCRGSSIARANSSAPTSELMSWVTRSRLRCGSGSSRNAIGIEPKRVAQPRQVPRKAPRVTGPRRAAQSGHVCPDRHHQTPRPAIVAMPGAEIAIDQQSRPCRRCRGGGNSFEVAHRRVKRRRAGLCHQLRLVGKMGIKTPVGQSRATHHLVHPGFGDTLLPESLAGGVENSATGGFLMSGRITHAKVL